MEVVTIILNSNEIHYKEIIELFEETADYYKKYIDSSLYRLKKGMIRIGKRVGSDIPDPKIDDLHIITQLVYKRILALPKGIELWRIKIKLLSDYIHGFVIIINKSGDLEPIFHKPLEFESVKAFNNWIVEIADIQIDEQEPRLESSYYTDFQENNYRLVMLTPINFSAIFGSMFKGSMVSMWVKELITIDYTSEEFLASELGCSFYENDFNTQEYFALISQLDNNLKSNDNFKRTSNKVIKMLDKSKLLDIVPEEIYKRIEAIRKGVILSLVEKDISIMVITYLALTYEAAVTEAFDKTLGNSIEISSKNGQILTINDPSYKTLKMTIKNNNIKNPIINNCNFPRSFAGLVSYLIVQGKISHSLAVELEYWKNMRNYWAHSREHSILALQDRIFLQSCDVINRLFAEIYGFKNVAC